MVKFPVVGVATVVFVAVTVFVDRLVCVFSDPSASWLAEMLAGILSEVFMIFKLMPIYSTINGALSG